MKEIHILDKKFSEYLTEKVIQQRIEELALQMNKELAGKEVVFLGILNGAFLFAADLFRRIEFPARISFVKLASGVTSLSSTPNLSTIIAFTLDAMSDIIPNFNYYFEFLKNVVQRKCNNKEKTNKILYFFGIPLLFHKITIIFY